MKNKIFKKRLLVTATPIWVIGLMKSWFCIWNDLANPKNGLNLVQNPL